MIEADDRALCPAGEVVGAQERRSIQQITIGARKRIGALNCLGYLHPSPSGSDEYSADFVLGSRLGLPAQPIEEIALDYQDHRKPGTLSLPASTQWPIIADGRPACFAQRFPDV